MYPICPIDVKMCPVHFFPKYSPFFSLLSKSLLHYLHRPQCCIICAFLHRASAGTQYESWQAKVLLYFVHVVLIRMALWHKMITHKKLKFLQLTCNSWAWMGLPCWDPSTWPAPQTIPSGVHQMWTGVNWQHTHLRKYKNACIIQIGLQTKIWWQLY